MFKTKLEVDRHVDNCLKKINNETERNLRCFSFAKLYFNVGDYEQACRYVSSYLSVKPKSPEGYQLLGKALEKLGKKQAALEAFRTSLQLDPKQHNLVIKVCELLSSDEVNMDHSGAQYFCNLAQSFDPHNPAVFSLRERLITRENDDPVEVSKLLLKELEARPTDVNLRVRLVQHFLQSNLIKEAYKHASAIEEKNLSIFHNNLSWYETFAEVLVRFQRDLEYSSQLTWEFWFLSVSVLDRLAALSLDEHLDNVKTSNEYVAAVFNFDQMLSKASQSISTCPDRQLVAVFLNHYHAQLHFHLATLVFKQAKKDLIQFKEACNITLPSMWLIHSPENRKRLVQHWHKEACYRCSQSGHLLLGAAKDRKSIVLEKATQYSTGMWREQFFKKVFVKRDQQLKISTSFFVSNSQALEPAIKLPDPSELVKYDECAQLVYPDSLHHYIWLGLNSKLSDMEVKPFEGLQYSVKNLNNCAAETLNILDIQSFLYCAILCAKSKLEDTKHLIYYNHDKPSTLPASVMDYLGTLNQSKFITAAYKMYNNEPTANMGEVRLLLIKGIEVVRCVGHHGLDVRLLVTLAKIFEERSKRLTKHSEIEFNDARAELYWKTALPLLEKIKNNQMVTYSNNRLFEYKSKDISISEASAYIENGKLFTAVQLMKKKEYERALHIFEQLKDPYASFYQSEIYKHMAEQKTSQSKENVTSEMRSQNIILLSRARDCLYLTLDRLREPAVDRSHPLNSQLGTEIEKIERLLSRIDPDCTNRNECDGMSDENQSSDNSVGENYLSTYTHASFHNGTPKHENHNHSTPLRINISRQEARPSPERLDAQIRQMVATRDATLTTILEQLKLMVDSNRCLVEELRSLKDKTVDDLRSVGRGFEEIKDIKKSVDELKTSVDGLQNVCDIVQEMKKEISDMKNHAKNNQLSDEDLYVLDPDYGVDYNINSNVGAYSANLPNVVYPNYQAGRMANPSSLAAAAAYAPGLYPGLYPGLTYAYGGLGLPQPGTLPFLPDQQLSSIAATVAASYAQPILGQPTLTQGLPSTSLGVNMLTGQILSQTAPHIAQPVKESAKVSTAPSTVPSIFLPSSAPAVTTTTMSSKAAPVNVVITNSDPLPTTRAPVSQPVLSVTIPPQHIKGSVAKSQPHNYQIPLPSTAATAIASTPSVLSKPPPAISTQSLLSNISPPVFSAVSQNKTSPSKNVSLGLQIEKTLDHTFNSDKNDSTLINASSTSIEEHDPCPDFKPIIPLPDEVPVNTGEESETELFCERAKLFRHVNNNGVKEWKERGIGNIKILNNPSTGKVRILMRRDQVHKICANHFITKDMTLTPISTNDRAYIWAAHDFADESVVLEKFCVRFKTSEEARRFHEAFEASKKLVKEVPKSEASPLQVKEKPATVSNKPAAQVTTSLGGFVFTSTPTFKPKEIVAPVKVEETSEPPKTSPFSTFTFGKSITVTPVKSEFKPVQTSEATKFSPLVITQTSQKDEGDDDSHVEDFVPTAEFKPVVALPELVDLKTGEENSEVLFECRAKLFRYDTSGEVKEWKERGVGTIKILKDESIRLLMRRDQVLKVCCNHKVLKDMTFKQNASNPKAVVWHAQDFSEGVLTPETFTARFKTEEQAIHFLQVLQTAQTSLDESNKISGKHHKPEARPRTTSFGDKFKPAKGSWECKNCYIINEGKVNHCIACESPKPGTSGKKPEETGMSGPVFSFGVPTTHQTDAVQTGGFTFTQKPALDTSKGINLDTPGQKFNFGIPQTTSVATEPTKTFAFGVSTTASAGTPPQFSFGTKSTPETKTSSTSKVPTSTPFTFTQTTPKTDSKFVFGSPQKHEFEFKPRSPRRVSAGQGDEESDGSYVEEEEDNIYFKPVIPLPDKVDVKTGEENETVLYSHRAKLFRFVGGEWKERGLGDVKILRSNDNGKLRVVMRREQVLKICLNHHLTKDTEYILKDEKSWLFHAADFSEGELAHEQFCLRFKNAEVAQEFKQAVTDAVNNSGGSDADRKMDAPKLDSDDEVEIVFETKVTPEEEREAIRLGLPPKFFAYRQLPDCTCDQCKKDDEYLSELFGGKRSPVKYLASEATPNQKQSSGTAFGTPLSPSSDGSVFVTPKEQQTSFTFTPQKTKQESLRDLLLKPSKLEESVTPTIKEATTATSTTSKDEASATNSFSFTVAKTTAGAVPTTASFSIFTTTTSGLFGNSTTSTNLFSSSSSTGSTGSIFGNSGSTTGSIFGSTASTFGNISNSATPLFGSVSSSSTSIFGMKPSLSISTTPVFGANTSSGSSNIFNVSVTPSSTSLPASTTSNIFDSTKKASTPIFGTATPTGTTAVFGTPTTTSASIFCAAAPMTGTSIFGSTASPIFGTPKTTSIFGTATSNTPVFGGVKTTTPIFGSTTTTTSTPVFGTPVTTTSSTPSIFNTTKAAPASGIISTTTGSIFEGASTPTTSAGIFGQGTNVFGSKPTTGTSIFGTAVTSSNSPITTSNLFGNAQTGSIFGSKPGPMFGGNANIFGGKPAIATEANAIFGGETKPSEKSTINLKEDDELVLKCESGLTFASLAANTTTVAPAFNKSGDSSFAFLGAGTPVFAARKDSKKKTDTNKSIDKSKTESDEEAEAHGGAEEEYDPHYEPIVPLPDAIVVSTGEENEDVLFNERAKLFRYDDDTKEWKERGVGQIKVLHHPQNNTFRLLLRREQVHKVVLNQLIVPNLELQPLLTSDKAWMWAGYNYTDEENNLEKLAVRFKNVELAKQFHDVVQDVIRKATEAQNSKSLPATVQNYGVEDVSSDEQNVQGETPNDDEEDEDEDDDDDDPSVMFMKRCTLSEELPDGSWKLVTMGDLQVYYDPELYAARIAVNDDSGNMLSNTIIGMNTIMDIEKTECLWKAVEWADGGMKWRTLKAAFSSEMAAQEFHSNYLEGLNYAQEVGIIDEVPHDEHYTETEN
ncbi:hypothetical protein NQ315_000769 [Exocentrus adspersus]|uniref:Nuclear pore complex protein Nup153 n=1 Tax=Exocentrus adspersus TaxID=1586481 RepID=A0AAV8WDJ3_9CUCU|nr:hypothetical protein NQ315_000769 [Exocentrus adspersus]